MYMSLEKSIRKILREYIEEARLSDLLTLKGDGGELHSYIEKEKSKKFEVDRGFPTEMTLKKRFKNKKIKVYFTWYDTSEHDLKKRIIDRTSFKSISEFASTFKETINKMLPDELGFSIIDNDRFAISLKEYDISIIFNIDLRNLEKNIININVLTILPHSQIDTRNIENYFVY